MKQEILSGNTTDKTRNAHNETGQDFITQTELDALNPKYYDLRTIAVCEGSTWHFLGTNVWFKTSGK